MSMKDTYRDLAIKAKTKLEINDYIERVNTNILPLGKVHYLPWWGIMKNESATTKLRIVMDASAKFYLLNAVKKVFLLGGTGPAE